ATASVLRKLFGQQPAAAGNNDNSGSTGTSIVQGQSQDHFDYQDTSKSTTNHPSQETTANGVLVAADNDDNDKQPGQVTPTATATVTEVESQSHAPVNNENKDTAMMSINTPPPPLHVATSLDDARTHRSGNEKENDGYYAPNLDANDLIDIRSAPQASVGTKSLVSPMGEMTLSQMIPDSINEVTEDGRDEDGHVIGAPEEKAEEEKLSEEEKQFRAEREKHLVFIEEALDMARLALKTNETPVGCVLVHEDKVIARGMNATNVTRNGTRHAEFMAVCALLSYAPKNGPRTTCLKPRIPEPERSDDDAGSDSGCSTLASSVPQPDEGNEDGRKGHLYPYGQKEHPAERVDRSILRECTLYVTVEPCVMCASLLRQLGIKKVFFGAVNDKFGGTGGVFSIHANSLPVRDDGQTASAHPQPPPMRLPNGNFVLGTSFPEGGGDGGNVEPGYEIEGGWGRDEAVALLRRFYVQENGRDSAPVPRKKEGRAARLAALENNDDAPIDSNSGSTTGGTGPEDENAAQEGTDSEKKQEDPSSKEANTTASETQREDQ
ncbi:Pyrimidine deaminase domain of riboflavin biosynthesis protein RibD, partial [Geosmithia morbida]